VLGRYGIHIAHKEIVHIVKNRIRWVDSHVPSEPRVQVNSTPAGRSRADLGALSFGKHAIVPPAFPSQERHFN